MKHSRGHALAFFLMTAPTVVLVSTAAAHEPVFSLGPRTIWEGGVGIETNYEFEDQGGEQLSVLNYEVLYGVTNDLALTFKVPQILEREVGGETEHGSGDIEIRAKYRILQFDALNASNQVSGIFGVKVPTGDEDANPALGTGTTDFLFGATYGYESRFWYHFATVRYRWRTESGNRDPGDRLFVDAAMGIRPFPTEYDQSDLVLLAEMNAEFESESEFAGQTLPDTGGDTIWLGPTILFSPNPQWMYKGGIQFPIYEDLKGDQEGSEFRAVFGIEFHF
jgi:Putative MetA-pathway of phenol degradation